MESVTNLTPKVFIFFCVYLFMSAMDGFVILPTAWYYVHSLGYSETFYGAVIAAPSVGFILFSPLVSKVVDKTRKTKLVLLVFLLVKVSANLVYAIPVSGYCPMVGLFFSGVANCAIGFIYGEVVRYTRDENRSVLFILCDILYTIGAACGPMIGSVITIKANILGWNINEANSPGIAVATIWFMTLCGLVFLPSESGTNEVTNDVSMLSESSASSENLVKSLNSKVWCLYYIHFTSSLVHVTCSAILPLLAMELFRLQITHVRLLFGVAMTFVLLVNLSTYKARSRHSDRSILVFTAIFQAPAMLFLSTYALLWTKVPFSLSYTLMIFICFALPLPFAFIASLLSMLTSSQHASSIQNFTVVCFNVALLIGRTFTGLAFSQTCLIAYSVVLVTLWSLGLIWLGFVYRRLPAGACH